LSIQKKLETAFNQWGGSNALLFTFIHLANDLPTGLLMAMLPLIKADLGLSYLQAGVLMAAHHIIAGLAQFPGGWLGDRFSRRVVIAVGLAGVGLTAVAVGLSSTYYLLLVVLFINGIFGGAYHPSATSILSNYFEEKRRGKVIALHLIGGSIGFMIGPILGGLIANVMGWRFAFIILGIPTVVAALLALVKLRGYAQLESGQSLAKATVEDSTSPRRTAGLSNLGRVLRPVAGITALAISIQLVVGSAVAFFPVYLVDKHAIDPSHAAMWLGVLRGGAVAGSLFGGWLSDRWGRKNAIILTLLATGPVFYLLTALPFNPALVAVFVVFGMLMQMRQATIQPFLMDSTPPALRGTVFGIYFGLSMEGSSLVQPIAGHYMDVFGIVNVFHVIGLLGIAMSLVTLVLIRKLKRAGDRGLV